MKRYWAAAILAVFIVLAIGIYYVQASSSRLPQFRLATLEGDAKAGAGLTLKAQLAKPPYSENVDISSTGSRYDSERTLLERFRNRSYSPILEKVIQEYPSFMRGKFKLDYQDDDILANADLQPESVMNSGIRYRFDIEILDKKTNRARSFQPLLPDSKAYNGAAIIDVQKIGSRLKIAVEYNTLLPDGRRAAPEIRIYELNMDNGQLTDDRAVEYGLVPADDQEVVAGTAIEWDFTRPNDELILDMSVMNLSASKADSKNMNAAAAAGTPMAAAVATVRELRQVVIYQYTSGQTKTIALPKGDPASQEEVYALGKYVLLIGKTPDTVSFKRYRLEDGGLENEGKLSKQDLRSDSIDQVMLGQNRLYLLCKTAGRPSVTAVNPADGKIVYRGEVKMDGVEQALPTSMLSAIQVYGLQYDG